MLKLLHVFLSLAGLGLLSQDSSTGHVLDGVENSSPGTDLYGGREGGGKEGRKEGRKVGR